MNKLVAQEEATWRRFRDTVGRLSLTELESSTPAGWTAKEMLGHLAFWAEATESVIVGMSSIGGSCGNWMVSEDMGSPNALFSRQPSAVSRQPSSRFPQR